MNEPARVSGTLQQIVFEYFERNGSRPVDELFAAFPTLPAKSLREAVSRLVRDGYLVPETRRTLYTVPRGTLKPTDRRGRR